MADLILPGERKLSPADEAQFQVEVMRLSLTLSALIQRFDPDPRVVRKAVARYLACHYVDDFKATREAMGETIELTFARARNAFNAELVEAKDMLDKALAMQQAENDEP